MRVVVLCIGSHRADWFNQKRYRQLFYTRRVALHISLTHTHTRRRRRPRCSLSHSLTHVSYITHVSCARLRAKIPSVYRCAKYWNRRQKSWHVVDWKISSWMLPNDLSYWNLKNESLELFTIERAAWGCLKAKNILFYFVTMRRRINHRDWWVVVVKDRMVSMARWGRRWVVKNAMNSFGEK